MDQPDLNIREESSSEEEGSSREGVLEMPHLQFLTRVFGRNRRSK